MPIMKKKQLDELVGGDINAFGNDKPFNNNSEIETGPVQKAYNDDSDYQKGVSTTSDVVFGLYRQNIPWFAVYSYGGRRSQGGIVTFESEDKKNVLTKNKVEEKIDDLVKKSKNSDVTSKDYNPKVSKLIDTIEDAELTEKQLEELKKAIKTKQASKKI